MALLPLIQTGSKRRAAYDLNSANPFNREIGIERDAKNG